MYSLSPERKTIAPGPISRALRFLIWAATSSLDLPGVTLNDLPSMKMLSLLAMLRTASWDWAMASVETLDIMATVAAMSVADLHLGPVILLSCEGRRPFWPGGTPFRQRKSGVVLMQINGGPMHGEEPATTGPGVGRLCHLIASSKEFGFSVSTADLMAA